MSETPHQSSDEAQKAVGRVEQAIRTIFADGRGTITPAVETQLQRAIQALRSSGCGPGMIEQAEGIARLVAVMAQAQRSGMPNLYASKMLRLRRLVEADARPL